jgi:hypothetical protein
LHRRGRRHLGRLLGLEFQEFLHIADGAFELADAILGFLQGTALGRHLLLQGLQSFLGLRVRLAGAGSRLPLGQLEHILGRGRRGRGLFLGQGRDLAGGGFFFRLGHRPRHFGQFPAIGMPFDGMSAHGARGLPGRGGHHLAGFGHIEDLAAFQPVHVVVGEGALVGLIEAHHHLFQAHFRRLHLAGDGAQGFTRSDRTIAPRSGGGRSRGRGQRLRLLHLGAGGLPRFAIAASLGNGHRFDGFRGLRVGDRIQQDGVFTDDPTGTPVEFDQQIQKGIGHACGGRDADDGLAVGALIHGEAQVAQGLDTIDARLFIGVVAGDPGRDVRQFLLADGEQFDLRPEGLSQGGLNRELAEPRGAGGARRE